jgi:hypothetical protein
MARKEKSKMKKQREKQAAKISRRDFIIGSGSVTIGGDTGPVSSVWQRLVKMGALSIRLETPGPSSRL